MGRGVSGGGREELRIGGRVASCQLPVASNPQSEIRNPKSVPFVLIRTVASRQLVIAVSVEAKALGIRPGITLAQARAIRHDVQHEAHEPHKDATGLEALARWMMRFSPVVALDMPVAVQTNGSIVKLSYSGRYYNKLSAVKQAKADAIACAEHGIFLDVTGCERLFDGLENLARQVEQSLRRFGIAAELAIGPTPGAAWAKTFGEESELDHLPAHALRLDNETLHQLHHLGVHTIGQVMKLPREALPARFGPLLTLRVDQALGRVAEPLVPLQFVAPIEARVDFEGAVESLEAIWLTFKELIGRIVKDLARHGRGARTLEVQFFRAYAQTLGQTIRLSRPSRDPVNLFNLLRCALETLETDDGFLGIRLEVTVSEPLSDEQIPLMGREEYVGEAELAGLIERLALRLGEKTVARPVPVESHLPERAWKDDFGFRISDGCIKRTRTLANPQSTIRNPQCSHRPLRLLPRPVEVKVMVSPSEDDEGRPVLFRRGREVHELRHAIGPERIAGEWWRGHHHTRDYFCVEDMEGCRHWLFRVASSRRWFVQGMFE